MAGVGRSVVSVYVSECGGTLRNDRNEVLDSVGTYVTDVDSVICTCAMGYFSFDTVCCPLLNTHHANTY